MAKFLRNVRVTVGNTNEFTVIDNFMIRFSIRKRATDTPADGTITVFNLNELSEERIRDRGVAATLEAGYAGMYGLLYSGSVIRVERERSGNDRLTHMRLGGTQQSQTQSVIRKTYTTPVPFRVVVCDIVNAMQLVADKSTIPDITVNPGTLPPNTRVALTTVTKEQNLDWYEENGIVKLRKPGEAPRATPSTLVINQATGMVGSPSITDDGIRVQTLLDHRVQLESIINVESNILQLSAGGTSEESRRQTIRGPWKVIEVEHTGDNRDGDFLTLIEARPIEG